MGVDAAWIRREMVMVMGTGTRRSGGVVVEGVIWIRQELWVRTMALCWGLGMAMGLGRKLRIIQTPGPGRETGSGRGKNDGTRIKHVDVLYRWGGSSKLADEGDGKSPRHGHAVPRFLSSS